MNRKGVFFTAMAIVILSIFVFGTYFYSGNLLREATQKRVRSLDAFVFSTEQDLQRKVYIHGYRSLLLLSNQIVTTHTYLDSVNETFNESFFNGTIGGVPQQWIQSFTFSAIEQDLQSRAWEIGANLTLSNPEFRVYQNDPWYVIFELGVDAYFYDINELASWNRTINVTARVPIEPFSDPVYLVGTQGVIVNKFERSPFEDFDNDANLREHINRSLYFAVNSSPSFLDRFEGNLNAQSPYGIESLVNLDELGSAVAGRSIVDYLYFGFGTSGCVVTDNVQSFTRIDDAHLEIYNVTCA